MIDTIIFMEWNKGGKYRKKKCSLWELIVIGFSLCCMQRSAYSPRNREIFMAVNGGQGSVSALGEGRKKEKGDLAVLDFNETSKDI